MNNSKLLAKKFENLFVWQKSRELTKAIYGLTRSSSWNDRSLANQIQRASVSVMSNVAEGFERGSKAEWLQFLYIARGSCGEVRAQLYIALDQSYVSRQDFDIASDLARYVSRLLARTIEGSKLKGTQGQKYLRPKDPSQEAFVAELDRIISEGKR